MSNFSVWLSHHWIAASLIILVASTAPRVFLAWRTVPSEVVESLGDPKAYVRTAQSLLSQQAFLGKYGKPEITRTPGYPAFLATIMLFVGKDLHTVLIVQAFILSYSVLVLYWLARRILPPATAFIAGLLAAFSPWGAVTAGLPLTEGLFLLLLALVFFAMKLTVETNSPIAVAGGGACIGLLTAAAVLVRPIWPLVLLVAGVLFVLYGPKRKRVWLLLSITLVFATLPLLLWKTRNQHVSHFNGISDIAGQTASQYLASRVEAYVNNQDRWELVARSGREESRWEMSSQQFDQERWRRVKNVLKDHPFLTVYFFLLSSGEHAIHPSPDVLEPAKLSFYGDYWVLALLWGGLLLLAFLGWQNGSEPEFEQGSTDRAWLSGLLIVCLLLTLSSGISFGGGSRFRVPLELIVPLLAAAGLSRMIFKHSLGVLSVHSRLLRKFRGMELF